MKNYKTNCQIFLSQHVKGGKSLTNQVQIIEYQYYIKLEKYTTILSSITALHVCCAVCMQGDKKCIIIVKTRRRGGCHHNHNYMYNYIYQEKSSGDS